MVLPIPMTYDSPDIANGIHRSMQMVTLMDRRGHVALRKSTRWGFCAVRNVSKFRLAAAKGEQNSLDRDNKNEKYEKGGQRKCQIFMDYGETKLHLTFSFLGLRCNSCKSKSNLKCILWAEMRLYQLATGTVIAIN